MTQKDRKPQRKMKDLNNHLLTMSFNSRKIMAGSISRGRVGYAEETKWLRHAALLIRVEL
jgi:hypothetical protein